MPKEFVLIRRLAAALVVACDHADKADAYELFQGPGHLALGNADVVTNIAVGWKAFSGVAGTPEQVAIGEL